MTPQSAKAKGRRLQQTLRDELLKRFPQLTARDVRSTGMGQTGTDIQMSEAASRLIPFGFECKAVEKLNVWEAWKQTVANAADSRPALVVSRNRQEPLAIVKLSDFLELLRG